MDIPPEVQKLALDLGAAVARNSAQAITDKVRSLRAGRKAEDTIAGLEEIISELIDDKAEITRIAQSYQSELVSQRLTPGDVRYIADTVVPLLEQLADAQGGDQGETFKKGISAVKPILSAEMVQVLQLLGFNFRRAIGEPLTELASSAIASRVRRSEEIQLAELQREQLYMQVALDPDAFTRLQAMFGR
ncbi:hypothetical protein QSU92_01275 [Microbacterium sp. ET2]|uniref:hypothetical protein n=1 Tax=Microbacterium albipurpureum TaxID=3050384 RepID=UPI00259CAFEA|nr:hypothetical protein [Microbacterium sp. ET2 (Ac-2212)]WJL95886.1 hypothetical protein QSU92_01275 [Microbacterium sp. ET2 (Ac-2212)]